MTVIKVDVRMSDRDPLRESEEILKLEIGVYFIIPSSVHSGIIAPYV